MEPKRRILIVDDRLELAETVADGLGDRGYDAVALASGREAVDRIEREPFDAVVTDLRMPDLDGLAVISAVRRIDPDRPVIVMTAYAAIDNAIECVRKGASHYLRKPFKTEELLLFLERAFAEGEVRREARALRAAVRDRFGPGALIAASQPMREVVSIVERVADGDVPVLLIGETGTGKGLLARIIHQESARAGQPFVTINCAAIPETLLESELFGHVRGAFSGATRDRAGLFAEAHGGTLFLDEIGEMSVALQAKLLDVLERKVVRPVGGSGERAVDVRIVTATHRDLDARVREGAFREDLYYRLDVVRIDLPALRHRREDIPLLAERFLAEARAAHPRSPIERLAPDVSRFLLEHPWPGNVRELRHVIERLVVLGRGAEANLADLPARPRAPDVRGPEFREPIIPVRELQQRYAAWALERLGGHRARTAETLGIDVKTLQKWLSGGGES